MNTDCEGPIRYLQKPQQIPVSIERLSQGIERLVWQSRQVKSVHVPRLSPDPGGLSDSLIWAEVC